MLVVLSGGGFSFETSRLVSALGSGVEFVYLRTQFGGAPGSRGLPEGASYLVPSFATKTRGSAASSLMAFLRTFSTSVHVVRRHNVDCMLVVGCSHAVPLLLAGRLLGTDSVFVESITRVDRLSTTGRIVYSLRLAKLFLVQWPRLQLSCPASRLGTIL